MSHPIQQKMSKRIRTIQMQKKRNKKKQINMYIFHITTDANDAIGDLDRDGHYKLFHQSHYSFKEFSE